MQAINNGWEFTEQWTEAFGNGEAVEVEQVRIPHAVKELSLHYADSDAYQMVSGYRRKLAIGEELKDKRLFLQFDGAAHIATVYVNGRELYTHRSGYTGFRVEVTDAVNYGEENLVAVRLDSTENPAVPPFGFVIDYLTYGGVYRDVWLDVRGKERIADFYVTTPEIGRAELEFTVDGLPMPATGNATDGATREDADTGSTKQSTEGNAVEPYRLWAEILDDDDKILGEKEIVLDAQAVTFDAKPETAERIADGNRQCCKGKMQLAAEDVYPWEPGNPNVYRMRLTLRCGERVTDTLERTFGFRTVSVTNKDILINGKPIFLRGLNRHQCWPYVGYAVPEKLQREDARILQEELQVNAVRTSHYPQSHYFLDECDRRGLLVFTEIPGWQHIGEAPEWKDQCVQNVTEMVTEYRHHPSIVLWGVRVNESQDDDELYARTNARAHELDPTRPTTGVRYIEKSSLLEDVYSFNDFSHEGNNPGAKAKKDVTPDVEKPLLISEANGHMFPTKAFDPWQKRQEHALRHARVLDRAMSDGGHGGCFQWCMFDYNTHKDFGSGDRICYHGVLDMFRNPKLAASVYTAQGEDVDVLEIGTPMDIGDYSAGQVGDIYAFTNADEVELYKNDQFVASFKQDRGTWPGMGHAPIKIDDTIGKLLETNEKMPKAEAELIRECLLAARDYGMANLPMLYKLKLAYAMFRYKLTFADGYRLYGTYVGNWGGESTRWRFDAKKHGRVVKSVLKTPSTKLHLDVQVSHTALTDNVKNGTYDMAAVRVRILDENDNAASYSQVPVYFETTGPIAIIGPQAATAEGGMTGTYIRTTGESGEATIRIRTDVTEEVVVSFNVEVLS